MKNNSDSSKAGRGHGAIPSAESKPTGGLSAAPSFTPGPWSVWPADTKAEYDVMADGFYVAQAFETHGPNAELVTLANARLVAASPSMYAALENIEAAHYAMRGEAKADPNRYCAVCVTLHTGRSKVWPCKTVKTARAALALVDDQQKGRK